MNSAPNSISGIVKNDAFIEYTPDKKAAFVEVSIAVTSGPQKGEDQTVTIEYSPLVKPEKVLDPNNSRKKPPAFVEAGTPITFNKLHRREDGKLISGLVYILPKPTP